MNAVQRWYLYSERGSERLYEAAKGPDMILDGTEQLWCREQDVAELERVIAEQSERIEKLRDSVVGARAEAMKLYDRLPERMKHCTIKFIECDEGHGHLTATNWVQHGCPTCEINDLKDQLRQAVEDDRGVL